MFFDEVNCFFKERPDFSRFLALEELRAGRYQRLHHPNAVLTGAALGLGDLPLCLRPVFPLRLDKMEIEVAPAGVHVWIAGVLLM